MKKNLSTKGAKTQRKFFRNAVALCAFAYLRERSFLASILTCLFLLITTTAIAQPAQEPGVWQRYTVKGEEFSVILPTVPTMSTSVFTIGPSQSQRERMLGAYADGLVYTVLCTENPKGQSLDNFIEEKILSRSRSWDRSSGQELESNGFHGKQYLWKNKVPGVMQVFTTGKNFYQFQVFGAADEARVKQYFSSMILSKKPGGLAVSNGPGVPYQSATADQDLSSPPFESKDVDRKPIAVLRITPGYTEVARQNGVTGTVHLRAVLQSDGSVGEIKVVSPLPFGLTDRSIEATKKLKFVPGLKTGKFVSVWMPLELNFNLY